MNKFRIFKCKKVGCYCDEAWIISRGGFVISTSARYDWALDWTLAQIRYEAQS